MSSTQSLTYADRLAILHNDKLDQARRKREMTGPRDGDEQGFVPLPPDAVETVEAVSGSGVLVRDVVLRGYTPESNHPSGGFFGARAVGRNFRRLLEAHPTYVRPANSMAGVYMVNFLSYRRPHWPPELDFSHLAADHERYGIDPGIGGVQHFCPDLAIGLNLGWGGLLASVRAHREGNRGATELYDGLEEVLLGVQDWVGRHAAEARRLASSEERPELRRNLEDIATACDHLVDGAPRTFREACQWLTFFQAVAKMYNGSGEWGRLDVLLQPFYDRDTARGALDDDEAIFHLACLLLSETAYGQLGGPDGSGVDQTCPVSFLILEAVHRLKTPANLGIRVGPNCSAALLRRGLEVLFEDRMGFPKFLADEPLTDGFVRMGCAPEVARTRVYAGCHWLAIPGREYGMCDMIKVDFARVFDLSLREMMADAAPPGTAALWRRFEAHLQRAVDVVAEGIDFHLAHMHAVFPELVLDLFCHGTVERGLDASQGGVEYTTIGVDGASLATVADSFAALETRVEREGRLTWQQMLAHLDADWAGPEGERARTLVRTIPRFGSGGSAADAWAERISATWTRMVACRSTPGGTAMVPGIFSWAKVILFGQRLGATPNGRKAGEPVSHGPNPDPGCNRGRAAAPTQLASAVARVQCGHGNTAPLQLDLDPGIADDAEGLERIEALLRVHFAQGGTMVNLNVLDRDTVLAAQADPESYPDLIVRVTGFSAYFASLSPELRQFVVDRIVNA